MENPLGLPHMVRMCSSCPFNKKSKADYSKTLSKERINSIIKATNFICHRSKESDRKQCHGHMFMFPNTNSYVKMSQDLGIGLETNKDPRLFTFQEFKDHYGIT